MQTPASLSTESLSTFVEWKRRLDSSTQHLLSRISRGGRPEVEAIA